MTCWTRRERWTASGSTGRIWAAARRGIVLLLLHAVLRAGLLAVAHAGGVERAADDLVADAREILDAAAADEDDRVLLEVVALTGDVGRDLDPSGDAHAGNLAQRRVRLLRRRGVDASADTPPLRRGDLLLAALAGLQTGGRELLGLGVTALANELAGRRHAAQDGSNGGVISGRDQGQRLRGRDEVPVLVGGHRLRGELAADGRQAIEEAGVGAQRLLDAF